MTDDSIEEKALALVNRVSFERDQRRYASLARRAGDAMVEALCRAIEQREAYEQKVSDIVDAYVNTDGGPSDWEKLTALIIPKPKPDPDPLVEMLNEAAAKSSFSDADFAAKFRAALEARGFEITEKKND